MAKPLSSPDVQRSGSNGAYNIRAALAEVAAGEPHGKPHAAEAEAEAGDGDPLRRENDELRALCAELEQALQEATQQNAGSDGRNNPDERMREYDALLEEKNEVIRSLHQDLQAAQCALAEAEAAAAQGPQKRVPTGPIPREEELLALSEELEQERRQLQEDEQTLMEQMREMEVGMAKERAEMARQRNDLQRLQAEIRHELERLEKNGALQSKIENLKSKLQDVSTRRGAAPSPVAAPSAAPQQAPAGGTGAAPPKKKDSFIGRLFG
jgi:hypothetical protein